ncbi:MAG: hypothetical protein V4650_07195 [Pseudomonadota bacterium]
MLVKKLTALIVVASALTIAGCNDDNTPRGAGVITTPTQPGTGPGTTPPPAEVITTGSFVTNQVKTLTCSNNNTVDVNAVTFTDSETEVAVESLDPACMGGPAS